MAKNNLKCSIVLVLAVFIANLTIRRTSQCECSPAGESIAGESAAKAGVLVGIFHPTLEPRLAGGSCEILDDNHSKQKTKDGDLGELLFLKDYILSGVQLKSRENKIFFKSKF